MNNTLYTQETAQKTLKNLLLLAPPMLFYGLALLDGFLVYKGTFAFIAWIGESGGPSIASLLGISGVVNVVWASITSVTAFITNIGGSLFWNSKRVAAQAGQGLDGSQRGRLLMGLVYLGLANLIVSPFRFFGLLSVLSFSPPVRQNALIAWSIAVGFLFMSAPMLLVYLLPWNISVDFSD